MWKWLVLGLACPAAFAAASTTAPEQCKAPWFADQLKAQFTSAPAPAEYDFIPSRDLPDSEIADRVHQGQYIEPFGVIANAMKDGGNVPVNVGLRGSMTTLDPLLQELQTDLKGKHLGKLVVFVAGPASLQPGYQSVMGDTGAKLVYTTIPADSCEGAQKGLKSRTTVIASSAVIAGEKAAPASKANSKAKAVPAKAVKPAKAEKAAKNTKDAKGKTTKEKAGSKAKTSAKTPTKGKAATKAKPGKSSTKTKATAKAKTAGKPAKKTDKPAVKPASAG